MSEDAVPAKVWPARIGLQLIPLINRAEPDGGGATSVAINHKQLDSLIGRLMQMCDLIGDIEQRKALKDTIKQITREWLDTEYENCGYERFTGAKPGVKTIDALYYKIEQ